MFFSLVYEKNLVISLCVTVYQAENILRNWNYKTKFQFLSSRKYFVELSLQMSERQCPLSSPSCKLICWTKVHIDPLNSCGSTIWNCNSFYNSFPDYTFSIFHHTSLFLCINAIYGWCQPELKGSIHQCSTATVDTTIIEYCVFEISILTCFIMNVFSFHFLKMCI